MRYKKRYMEVCIISEDESEYIYWVNLANMQQGQDEVDWAIQKAICHHIKSGGVPIAAQRDGFEPVTAYEPFARAEGECVLL